MSELATRRCKPCEGGVPPLDLGAAAKLKEQLDSRWKWAREGKAIEASFGFDNYYQTSAFVNAVVWIGHTTDHHPEISFSYKSCTVVYWTHAVDGLTENDFICAARIDALLA